MKSKNWLLSSYPSVSKHQQTKDINSMSFQDKQKYLLKESKDNSAYLKAYKINRTINLSEIESPDKIQAFSYHQINSERISRTSDTKSILINEISNRLTHLETKLNSYQNKADILRNSHQKPIKNNVNPNISNEIDSLTKSFPLESPTIQKNIQFSDENIEEKDLIHEEDFTNNEPSQVTSAKRMGETNDNSSLNQMKDKEQHKLFQLKVIEKLSNIKRDNNKTKEQMNNTQEQMKKISADTFRKIEEKIKMQNKLLFKQFKEKSSAIMKEKNKLQKEIKSMLESKTAMDKDIQQYKKDIDKLSAQLFKEKEDNMKYLTEIKAKLEPQIKTLKINNQELNVQLEKVKNELMQNDLFYQCKINSLESEMSKHEQEAKKAKSELTKAQTEIASLTETIQKSSKRLESNGELIFTSKSKIEMLSKQVKYKEGLINNLINQTQSTSNQHTENESKYKREMSVKNKELKTFREKEDKIMKQKNEIEMENRSLHLKNMELTKEKTNLEEQVKQMKSTINKYKYKTEEQSNDYILLNEELTSCRNELTKLRAYACDLEKKYKEYEELKSQMVKIKEEDDQEKKLLRETIDVINKNQLKKSLIDAKDKANKMPNDNAGKVNSNETYKKGNVNEHKDYEQYNIQEADESDEEDADQNEDNRSNDENSVDDKQSDNQDEENQVAIIQKLKIEIEDLIKENEELTNRYSQEKTEMQLFYQREKNGLIEQANKLNKQVLELKDQMNQYLSEYCILEIQLTQSNAKLAEIETSTQEKNNNLNRHLQSVKTDYFEYQMIESEINKSIENNENIILAYKKSLEELKIQNDLLKNKTDNTLCLSDEVISLTMELTRLRNEKASILEGINEAHLKYPSFASANNSNTNTYHNVIANEYSFEITRH